MAPVFTYRWQSVLFFGFLALMLALPYLPKPTWMDRAVLYRQYAYNEVHTTNIVHTVMSGTEDIDILFIGSSRLESMVNARLLRSLMKPYLGREPVIYVIGHPAIALDYDYMVIKDILSRRKIKLLFWENDITYDQPDVYKYIHYLTDMNLHGPLIRRTKQKYWDMYWLSFMTGWRLIVSSLEDTLPAAETDQRCDVHVNYGSCMRARNVVNQYINRITAFTEQLPDIPELTTDQLVKYRFSSKDLEQPRWISEYEFHFWRAMIFMLHQHDTRLALFNTGLHFRLAPHRSMKVTVLPRIRKTDAGAGLPILAPSYEDLFSISKGRKIPEQFFNEHNHYSYLGASYFTHALYPGVLTLFKKMQREQP